MRLNFLTKFFCLTLLQLGTCQNVTFLNTTLISNSTSFNSTQNIPFDNSTLIVPQVNNTTVVTSFSSTEVVPPANGTINTTSINSTTTIPSISNIHNVSIITNSTIVVPVDNKTADRPMVTMNNDSNVVPISRNDSSYYNGTMHEVPTVDITSDVRPIFPSTINGTGNTIINGTGTQRPGLKLKQGNLVGLTDIDLDGNEFYSFMGIPYAKPPIGNLRFKAPEPLEKWKNDPLMATNGSKICPQIVMHQLLGDEDCLYLNVHTKKLNPTGTFNTILHPVFVWIHGGVWIEGSGSPSEYGPHYLLTENITLVTFNYRLGSLGFLSFVDSKLNISGNAGLKDQVMVLKWVEENIVYFGGDPNRITIGGVDSGAASVEYLMVSPLSSKMFNRVILMSGNSVPYWAKGKPHGISLAKLLDHRPVNFTERQAFNVIRNHSALEILQASALLRPEMTAVNFIGPIIEPMSSRNAVVTRSPQEIIQSKNFDYLPYLTGFTSKEGYSSFLMSKRNSRQVVTTVEDFEKVLPEDLNLIRGSNKSRSFALRVKQFYFGNSTPTLMTYEKLFRVHSDPHFVYPIHKEARLLMNKSPRPVYLYRSSLDTDMNKFCRQQYKRLQCNGTAHEDDIGYIFSYKTAPAITPEIRMDIKRMVKLWGNFIRFGNPNGLEKPQLWNMTWLPLSFGVVNYLDIGKDLVTGVNPENEMIQFWEELYKEAESEDAFVVEALPTPPIKTETKPKKSLGCQLKATFWLIGVVFVFKFLQ